MDTDAIQDPVGHASIEVIIAAHAAFNARRLDELEALMHEDVDLFLPLSLRLRPDDKSGVAALRAAVDNVLALAPDLWMELERAEVVGDLVIVNCVASATGTDGKRYEWPLRVLVAEERGRITRYVVRAPHADIPADAHAFGRAGRA